MSRGIGGALARKFASEDYHVILSGRTVEKVQTVEEEIRNQGNSAIAMQVDVSPTKDQDSLFEHVESRDKVSAVLSNAGNNANIPPPSRKELLDSFEELGHIGHFSPQNVQFSLSNSRDLEAFFAGASGSLSVRPNFGHFASTKVVLRMLAQSLAREY